MDDPGPLSALRDCLARQGGPGRIGVAVSGGGDSVAALVLAVEAQGAGAVSAVTVDHGLRSESAAEAAQVAELCLRLGVAHRVLRWTPIGRGNLQQEARRARLDLIGGWAEGRVDAVILGHTRDDQAETVLIRLARGSGVDGLSAMDEARRARGTVWLRPFLGVSRADLRGVLVARGVTWIEDPSNDDDRFLRVRARQALATLAPLGIDVAGLAATAMRMRRARAALEAATRDAIQAHVVEELGTARLDRAVLTLAPEIRDRLIAELLMALSGSEHRPRHAALLRLIEAGGTLMGCVLEDEGAHLRLYREPRAVAALSVPTDRTWDRRWRATGPGGGVIRALGERGLAQLSAQARAGLHPHWRETGMSQRVLAGLPAIWVDQVLIAAPLVFWPQKWHLSARPLAARGNQWELSH